MTELVDDRALFRIENYPIGNSQRISLSITSGEWVYVDTRYAQEIFNLIRSTSRQEIKDQEFGLFVSSELKNTSQIRQSYVVLNPTTYYPDEASIEDLISAHTDIFSTSRFNAQSLISQLDSYNIKPTDLASELFISDQITFELLKLIASDVKMILINRSLDLLEKGRRNQMLAILYNKTLLEGLSVIISTNNNSIKSKYLGRTI